MAGEERYPKEARASKKPGLDVAGVVEAVAPISWIPETKSSPWFGALTLNIRPRIPYLGVTGRLGYEQPTGGSEWSIHHQQIGFLELAGRV